MVGRYEDQIRRDRDPSSHRYCKLNGDVEALKWWRTSKFGFIYDEEAIDRASRAGKIESLNWWKASGLPLKHTAGAINRASNVRYINILE